MLKTRCLKTTRQISNTAFFVSAPPHQQRDGPRCDVLLVVRRGADQLYLVLLRGQPPGVRGKFPDRRVLAKLHGFVEETLAGVSCLPQQPGPFASLATLRQLGFDLLTTFILQFFVAERRTVGDEFVVELRRQIGALALPGAGRHLHIEDHLLVVQQVSYC